MECWLGSFVIFKGIRTCIAKKTYIFVIFRGGGGGGGGDGGVPDPLSPPLDLRMGVYTKIPVHIVCFLKKLTFSGKKNIGRLQSN